MEEEKQTKGHSHNQDQEPKQKKVLDKKVTSEHKSIARVSSFSGKYAVR